MEKDSLDRWQVPLSDEDIDAINLALLGAERVYLKRAKRYGDSGFSASSKAYFEHANKASRLASWILFMRQEERDKE